MGIYHLRKMIYPQLCQSIFYVKIKGHKRVRKRYKMEQIRQVLEESLNLEFISAILSNSRGTNEITKIKVRPIQIKEQFLYQLEVYQHNQVFQYNYDEVQACDVLCNYMECFKQLQIETTQFIYTILVSKKGKTTIKKKQRIQEIQGVGREHNRSKKYILQEGIPVPFLQDLGVMTLEGKIIHARFDKFRQINRFLEFIEDVLPQLSTDKEVTILDFGCGKSYLTFAMYYYLHELKQYDVRIIGLDLKKEVIRHCSTLAQKYGYEKLKFIEGDIADYTGVNQVDMVVTLHACDTATDYALAKAVGWKAKVILSVPCCQHEFNKQIHNEVLEPIFKYGLIKERMAALITDAMRAEYLTMQGYNTQILEFIDMEHTPKNILIRAVKTEKSSKNENQIRACEEFFHVKPTLQRLLEDKGEL